MTKTGLALAILMTSAILSPSAAQNIMGPTKIVSVTSTIPSTNSAAFPLAATHDGQTASNAIFMSGFVGSQGNMSAPGMISFTLDQEYDLTAAYLWNDVRMSTGAVGDYTYRFYNASNTLISTSTTFSSGPSQAAPQVNNLGNVAGVKRVELVILSLQSLGNSSVPRVEIREVAFNGTPTPRIQPSADVPGDHYACYRVRESQALRPETLQIRDQFGRAEVVLGRPVMVCNPSVKVHNDRKYEVRNPRLHMVCYDIARQNDQQRPRRVETNNQMSLAQMTVDNRQVYCVPSIKELVGEREFPFE